MNEFTLFVGGGVGGWSPLKENSFVSFILLDLNKL
jgi:hypothetical protein